MLQIFLARDYDLGWCAPYKHHVEALCRTIRSEGNVPLIIDAGANIGASTLWLALHFPDCQVFGIEPEQDNFALRQENVAGCDNVALFNAASWDHPGNLSLVHEGATGWSCRVEERSAETAAIPTVTIPELLATDRRPRPVIAKIDIEGAETALLRSGTE